MSPPCVFIATLQYPPEENNFKALNFMMIKSRCEDVWSHDVEKTGNSTVVTLLQKRLHGKSIIKQM